MEDREPAVILKEMEEFKQNLGFTHHNRLPYLYGAWKAKKQQFRWIAGTSRCQDEEDSTNKAEDGPPKNALSAAGVVMTKVLQHVMKVLRNKDVEGRSRGQAARYWVTEDIDEFVQEFRALSGTLSAVPWATYDFTTMYEALDHTKLLDGIMYAVGEAWEYEQHHVAQRLGKRPSEVELVLAQAGWYTIEQVQQYVEPQVFTMETLRKSFEFMLQHLYVRNGATLRRQEKGVPMGLECAPQMANLYGYHVESRWVDAVRPKNVLSRRFIDDIFVAGVEALEPGKGLPSEDAYSMAYKATGESPDSLIYLGIRLFKDEQGKAQTTLHDRAVNYPVPILRC